MYSKRTLSKQFPQLKIMIFTGADYENYKRHFQASIRGWSSWQHKSTLHPDKDPLFFAKLHFGDQKVPFTIVIKLYDQFSGDRISKAQSNSKSQQLRLLSVTAFAFWSSQSEALWFLGFKWDDGFWWVYLRDFIAKVLMGVCDIFRLIP